MCHFWLSVPVVAHTPTTETAANVRAEVARAGLSGVSLADGLGWSKSRTARRLSGETPFDVEELAALAAYLNVPLTRFLPDQAIGGAA